MTTSIMHLTRAATLLLASSFLLPNFVSAADQKAQEKKLIAVIQSDAALKAKSDACRQLAVIGTKDAIAPLAALLADEKLSHMARYALEPIPDPAVDEVFRKGLATLKGRPLIGVIGSVGVRKDTQTTPALAAFLKNSDELIAMAAARSLGNIGTLPAAQVLQGVLPNASGIFQRAVCEGLFRCAESLAAQGQNSEAFAIYGKILELKAPHQIQAGALRGGILTGQKQGLALLWKYLKSNDYILFSAAVQSSQEMTGSETTELLVMAVNDLSADHQILILQTMGNRGDAKALPAVINLAQKGQTKVRVAALRSIGQLGDASAVPTLFDASTGQDSEVAKTARTILAGMASDPEVDAAILAILTKGDTAKRLVAIDVVSQRRTPTANSALFKAAQDSDKSIRMAALNALGQTSGPQDLPDLISALLAAQGEGEIGNAESALQSVCGKTEDKDACAAQMLAAMPKANLEAKCALIRLLRVPGGATALQTVRTSTKDGNPDIQEVAIRTLCNWPSADAAPDLLAMAKSGPNASRQIAALRGYIRLIRDESLSVKNKLAMANEASALVKRNEEKKLLLGVLGAIPSVEALSMVMSQIDHPATQAESTQAAVAISGQIVGNHSAEVAKALPKVIEVTKNNRLKRQARDILNKAK